MKKKYLLFIFCVALISFIMIGVTTAYLTATDNEVNVFTVGKVSITLDETEVDELGNKISDKRVNENQYHLIPGYTYIKDPTVTIKKGSNDSYIRILITINKNSELKDLYGENFTLNDIYANWGENWEYIGKKFVEENVIEYEYQYKNIVNGLNDDNKLEPLFEKFTIPDKTTISELESLKDLKVKIKAQAIQASGFASVKEAWESFATQYKE